MSQPVWLVQLIKRAFVGRFLAASVTNLPVFRQLLDHWFFDGDDMMCLPHDRVIQINQPIDLPGEIILPSQVVEHFIEAANTHWIINTCLCRDANHCQEYPIDLGCLFLGEAAAGINPELGRQVTKQEALEHARRCREAGLIHSIGRNKLDTLWLGVGPGDKLLTICNCCPCCCLWGILPYTAPQISAKITRMPGVTITVNERCIGCGTCTEQVCFVGAIRLVNGRAVIDEACRGCGRCVTACPQEAIEIAIDDKQLVAQSIARLSLVVDVS